MTLHIGTRRFFTTTTTFIITCILLLGAAKALTVDDVSDLHNSVIADTSKNGKKCGNPGNPNRVFDLRDGHAKQHDCIATCEADDECVAFSGIFGSWSVSYTHLTLPTTPYV